MKPKLKHPIMPIADTDNNVGKAYAKVLRLRAQALRMVSFAIISTDRVKIADDLDTLAQIAESNPAAFRGLK